MKSVLLVSLITLFVLACSDDSEPDTTKKDSAVTADKGATSPDKGAMSPDKGAMSPDKGTTTPDKGTTTPDMGAADGSTSAGFAATVWPIFNTAGCSGSYCHGGNAGGLVMSSESAAYGNLVGVKGSTCGTRVKSGDAANSTLIHKLEGKGACFTGSKMPVGGSLTASQLSTIKAWINAGAAK